MRCCCAHPSTGSGSPGRPQGHFCRAASGCCCETTARLMSPQLAAANEGRPLALRGVRPPGKRTGRLAVRVLVGGAVPAGWPSRVRAPGPPRVCCSL
ncbi:hypothetical protein FA09DRAFT_243134 [Tilletiopsis washingtonensis]|uniref:Uncharacterized protein n=1 Tax=Tilletiopsis washingtonensis TaxID=58919 RepID=A0A316ZFT4_9BASI|nr:hypothetical protein FA09DRAFT_243134 [Tilletiopsis washingtonensis]PWN99133.1 hypothetical protein FA09DRAFT_243134 [Tilletiopsis washingtonensis]